MNLTQAREKLRSFLGRELKSFINDAVRPAHQPSVAGEQASREAHLIERATQGQAVRAFLESQELQDFLAQSEANLTTAMLALPLEDDAGRRNLAVAIQTQRQLVRFWAELSRGGRSAEVELERLATGPKPYF